MNTLRQMKPKGQKGSFVKKELYEKIWDEVCDWFDKNIDLWVRNIRKIYELTGDWGYSCLSQNWEFLSRNRDIPFSDDDIRNNIIEKIYCPMNWLYVHDDYGQNPMLFSEGFTGLMVTFHVTLERHDPSDEYAWSYSYNLSLNIGCGGHNAIK